MSRKIIKYTKEGKVIERYFEDNKTLRDIRYFNDDDELHRDGEPAFIIYHKNGKPCYEYYYKNNKIHNDIPRAAVLKYDEYGIMETRWYYENGEFKDSEIVTF